MLPPEPARVSATIGCPRSGDSRSAKIRATMSGAPPGGIGIATRMAFVGYCAWTQAAASASVSRIAIRYGFMRPMLAFPAMPRYFEDYQVGDEVVTPARTIFETDVVNFFY